MQVSLLRCVKAVRNITEHVREHCFNDKGTAMMLFSLSNHWLKFISVKLLLKKANPDIEDALN